MATLRPVISLHEFVFLSRQTAKYGDGAELNPVAAFVENEGLTLVVTRDRADAAGQQYHGIFRMITLQVQSSLHAVGLTATVATALSNRGVSANVVAAFHHDHLFVPSTRASEAMEVLTELMSVENQNRSPRSGHGERCR